ncbi:hypothetical protein MBLNU230_g0259t1 [Neophaeotheca triangularis]
MANDSEDAAESPHDFYELLGVNEGSSETEIRTAYRKTALKYHPDKVGPDNTETLDKFHLLQIAYDALSDPAVKERYDAIRRAHREKAARTEALNGKRKSMVEDLERRENEGAKRQKTEADYERKLERLREDTQRRRRAMDEMKALQREEERIERKKAKGEYVEDAGETSNGKQGTQGSVAMEHRTVEVRLPTTEDASLVSQEKLEKAFARFGPIEESLTLGEKKIKTAGSKHRQHFHTAAIIYQSIVGAHAAVTDFERHKATDPRLQSYHSVAWGMGKAPDFLPQPKNPSESPVTPTQPSTPSTPKPASTTTPGTPASTSFKFNPSTPGAHGLKSKPSFGSFKASASRAPNTPTNEELMHIRLRNAEKKRLEDEIRRKEAAADGG